MVSSIDLGFYGDQFSGQWWPRYFDFFSRFDSTKDFWIGRFLWLARKNFQQTKCEFKHGGPLNQGGNGTNSASDGLEGEAGYLQKASLWEKSVKL